MFEVSLNEQNQSIQIIQCVESGAKVSAVAEGIFAVDQAARIALILITHTTVSPNTDRCCEFLASILAHVGQVYHVSVFLRLSIFDGLINTNTQHFKSMDSNIMAIAISDLKHEKHHLQFDQKHYELITDKEIVLKHSPQLTVMINENEDFGAGDWNDDNTRSRITTASHVAMILDKTKNLPCGIGRSLMIQSKGYDEEILGYLSFIGVDRDHQGRGLGSVILHSLLSNSMKQKSKPHLNGLLCLICATEGVGGVAGPKLYKKFGFEFVSKTDNRLALFHSDEYR